MKTLTLFRHAKSSWSDRTLSDRDRPLNQRGERDAPAMGKLVVDSGVRPSLILTSPATRAWQTATAVAREIGYPIEFLQREEDLYLASLNTLMEVVAAHGSEFNHLMIVGHNPGLTEFANYLSPSLTGNLPTSGVVSVSFDKDDWSLRERPVSNLLVYDYPKKNR